MSPAALEFRYGAFGRPRLAEPGPLHFSLTGTAECVVVAVAVAPVGVDAEPVSPHRERHSCGDGRGTRRS